MTTHQVRRSRRGSAVALTITMLLAATIARAQTPATPAAAALDAAVRVGEEVRVITRDNRVHQGRVFSVEPFALEIVTHSRAATFAALEIRTIHVSERDGTSDGARRGAIIGLAVGGAIGFLQALGDCGRDGFLNLCSPGGFVAVAGTLGGLGAGIGALVGLSGDAMVSSEREVWRGSSGTSSLSLAPVLTPSSAGLNARIRW